MTAAQPVGGLLEPLLLSNRPRKVTLGEQLKCAALCQRLRPIMGVPLAPKKANVEVAQYSAPVLSPTASWAILTKPIFGRIGQATRRLDGTPLQPSSTIELGRWGQTTENWIGSVAVFVDRTADNFLTAWQIRIFTGP